MKKTIAIWILAVLSLFLFSCLSLYQQKVESFIAKLEVCKLTAEVHDEVTQQIVKTFRLYANNNLCWLSEEYGFVKADEFVYCKEANGSIWYKEVCGYKPVACSIYRDSIN